MSEYHADVIIAGAGPSGLIVGSEAALGGANVLILEKRGGPTWSRAGSIAPRVLEIFASRGIADAVLSRAHELHSDPYTRRGIWAGLQPIHYDQIDSDYQGVLMLSQNETETLLSDHFRSLGGDLRFRSEVTGVSQDADGVTVTYTDADGEHAVRGRYLVGADGNRSAVREAAGIPRHGTPARRYAVNVDAFIDNPHGDTLTVSNDENGWAMTYPLRDGVTRFAFIDAATTAHPSDGPLELDEAKAMLRRVHGTDYGITEVQAINTFHDALWVADRIRDGRIFLVGESVRVHYPASGVGMNFCLQDGFNLGWKLAAAVAGRAPDWLLDTYVTERLPEIEKLIDDVQRQCAIQFNFDAEHVALKKFIENDVLTNPAMNRRICENLAGLSAAYPAAAGSPEIVGRRLPNLEIGRRDGASASVFELLRAQKFLLLDLTGEAAVPPVASEVHLVAATAVLGNRAALAGVATVLVRPDGHVAWAGAASMDSTEAQEQVRIWLNLPADPPVLLGREERAHR
jgi:2-polyprenyl-6-methoxyphenol hydroxylase and related FAD-dependent oxidoreductases